jgi:hypothetical protein
MKKKKIGKRGNPTWARPTAARGVCGGVFAVAHHARLTSRKKAFNPNTSPTYL